MERQQGSIVIDGLDISTIPRQSVRSKINSIPQAPYFLAGTVRTNADPYGASTDDAIIDALVKVGLWTVFEKAGGLDLEFDIDSLSHGQRQLFCLARATLRRGKIVILDEVTSSVDRKSDELMQRIIREEFADCTIIAIAHRLDTILDFDRIVVLDSGRVVECESPATLLAQNSAFKRLYEMYETKREDTDDLNNDSGWEHETVTTHDNAKRVDETDSIAIGTVRMEASHIVVSPGTESLEDASSHDKSDFLFEPLSQRSAALTVSEITQAMLADGSASQRTSVDTNMADVDRDMLGAESSTRPVSMAVSTSEITRAMLSESQTRPRSMAISTSEITQAMLSESQTRPTSVRTQTRPTSMAVSTSEITQAVLADSSSQRTSMAISTSEITRAMLGDTRVSFNIDR